MKDFIHVLGAVADYVDAAIQNALNNSQIRNKIRAYNGTYI